MELTIKEIKKMLDAADESEFAAISQSLSDDTRIGVKNALKQARLRLDNTSAEHERINAMYGFEDSLSRDGVIVGLDEVGRGSIAGPLAVGACVLDRKNKILGLNDSKKLSAAKREQIAKIIENEALAWTVFYVSPEDIDKGGMASALRQAFIGALSEIEKTISVDVVLLDGNALKIDPREINVIKGDAKCASIAAASIIAKVKRDALMDKLDKEYPGFDLSQNKGYGTKEHMDALRELGMTKIHRESFCGFLKQATLF